MDINEIKLKNTFKRLNIFLWNTKQILVRIMYNIKYDLQHMHEVFYSSSEYTTQAVGVMQFLGNLLLFIVCNVTDGIEFRNLHDRRYGHLAQKRPHLCV